MVHEGLGFPNGIVLSPDQRLLAVADYASKWVWSFTVGPDGSLGNRQPFYRLETPDTPLDAAADGMTFDSEGYLYVATQARHPLRGGGGQDLPPRGASEGRLPLEGRGLPRPKL